MLNKSNFEEYKMLSQQCNDGESTVSVDSTTQKVLDVGVCESWVNVLKDKTLRVIATTENGYHTIIGNLEQYNIGSSTINLPSCVEEDPVCFAYFFGNGKVDVPSNGGVCNCRLSPNCPNQFRYSRNVIGMDLEKREKAGIIFIHDNKVLMVQSTTSKLWGFPKGTKNTSETFEECALRELYEECGIKLNPFDIESEIKFTIMRTVLYVHIHTGEFIPNVEISRGECMGYKWVDLKAVDLTGMNHVAKSGIALICDKGLVAAYQYFNSVKYFKKKKVVKDISDRKSSTTTTVSNTSANYPRARSNKRTSSRTRKNSSSRDSVFSRDERQRYAPSHNKNAASARARSRSVARENDQPRAVTNVRGISKTRKDQTTGIIKLMTGVARCDKLTAIDIEKYHNLGTANIHAWAGTKKITDFKHDLGNLSLNNTMPYSREHKDRSVGQHGQRKLLCMEVMFLTQACRANVSLKVVVYAGAADGRHLGMLARMFSNLTFHLYDTRPMYSELEGSNLRIHNALMTLAELEGYDPDETCLISDIRTSGTEYDDEAIIRDMNEQRTWCESFRPLCASLKFRLPYDADDKIRTVEYLCGALWKQPWAKGHSTEMRLFSQRPYTRTTYDIKKYNDAMFYHNVITRHTTYATIPTQLHDQCYDCAYEVAIFTDYINTMSSVSTLEDIMRDADTSIDISGHEYYLSILGKEFKGPWSSVRSDAIRDSITKAVIAEAYINIEAALSPKDSPAGKLRASINTLKWRGYQLLRDKLGGNIPMIIEFFGGKGSDLNKIKEIGVMVTRYVDNSDSALAEARSRGKELDVSVDTVLHDLGLPLDNLAKTSALVAHLGLHHITSDAGRMTNFVSNVAATLTPGGIFITSFTSPQYVINNAGKGECNGVTITQLGTNIYNVVIADIHAAPEYAVDVVSLVNQLQSFGIMVIAKEIVYNGDQEFILQYTFRRELGPYIGTTLSPSNSHSVSGKDLYSHQDVASMSTYLFFTTPTANLLLNGSVMDSITLKTAFDTKITFAKRVNPVGVMIGSYWTHLYTVDAMAKKMLAKIHVQDKRIGACLTRLSHVLLFISKDTTSVVMVYSVLHEEKIQRITLYYETAVGIQQTFLNNNELVNAYHDKMLLKSVPLPGSVQTSAIIKERMSSYLCNALETIASTLLGSAYNTGGDLSSATGYKTSGEYASTLYGSNIANILTSQCPDGNANATYTSLIRTAQVEYANSLFATNVNKSSFYSSHVSPSLVVGLADTPCTHLPVEFYKLITSGKPSTVNGGITRLGRFAIDDTKYLHICVLCYAMHKDKLRTDICLSAHKALHRFPMNVNNSVHYVTFEHKWIARTVPCNPPSHYVKNGCVNVQQVFQLILNDQKTEIIITDHGIFNGDTNGCVFLDDVLRRKLDLPQGIVFTSDVQARAKCERIPDIV